MAQADELLFVEEAAEVLGIKAKTLREYRVRGTAPLSWREGKRLVFPRSGLDAYVARKREESLRGQTA
jgi:predicted site-specific integrase-resolvase